MINVSPSSPQWTERPSAAESAVHENESMFRLLFERSADAITLQDPLTGAFLDVNDASVRMTGAPNKAVLLGSNPLIISPERQPDGTLSLEKVKSVIQSAMQRGSHRFEWMINRFDGTQLPVEIVLTLIRGGEKPLLLSVSRDITEQKRTENELRENQQLLVSVADNISEAIYRNGPNHELIFANRAYLQMSGYDSIEEMRHVPREKLYARPSQRVRLLELLAREGKFRNEEIEYIRQDGTHWWGLTNSLAVRDESTGKVLYHVGSVADITEHKRAADELRELNASLENRITERTAELTASEARLRTIVDHAPEAIVVFDGDTAMFLTSNAHAQELYGCTAKELTRLGPSDVSPEFQADGRRSADAARDWINQAIAGKAPVFEWLHQHSSGRIIPTEVRLVRLPAEGKNLLRASIIDNTEHKRIEKKLHERGEQIQKHRDVLLKLARADKSDFDKALRAITTLAASTLEAARVSYWSLRESDSALVCELLHLNSSQSFEETFIGTRLGVTDSPAYFSALELKRPIVASDVLTHPATVSLVEGYLNPLGITSLLDVPVWVRGEVVGVICHEHIGPAREWSAEEIDFASSLAAMVSLALEESSRARSEQLLRKSEEKFKALFALSPLGMARVSWDGKFLQVNDSFARIIGRTPEEVLSLSYWDVTPRDYEAREMAVLETLQKTGRFGPFEKEYLHRNGHRVPIVINGMLVKSPDGADEIWGIVEDNTQRKQGEAELLKSLAREKELGQLKSNFVSMVSHEFRTPLGIIQSSAEILNDYLDQLQASERAEQLASITSNTRRMAEMMEEILVLSRLDAGRMDYKPMALDLKAFCRRVVDKVQFATDGRCHIELSLADVPDEALADERLLGYMFTNLLINAVKYSEPGGQVRFAIEGDGADAVCTIRDRGIGIPETDQQWLFHAFQRGANVGDRPGTGLGLVIVKRCVELHGGKIQIKSKSGAGTEVTLRLPLFPIES